MTHTKQENWRKIELNTLATRLYLLATDPKNMADGKSDEFRTQFFNDVGNLLTHQREEFESSIQKYIQEDRHKVERMDRYVLDDLLTLLSQEDK